MYQESTYIVLNEFEMLVEEHASRYTHGHSKEEQVPARTSVT